MRIERLQHAVDGAVDQPIGFDRLGVVRLNGAQRRRERLVVIGKAIFGGQGAAAEAHRRPAPTAAMARVAAAVTDLYLRMVAMLKD